VKIVGRHKVTAEITNIGFGLTAPVCDNRLVPRDGGQEGEVAELLPFRLQHVEIILQPPEGLLARM